MRLSIPLPKTKGREGTPCLVFIINDGFDFRQGNYNALAAFFYERVSYFIYKSIAKLLH